MRGENMNIKTYSIIVTGVAVAALVTLGLWTLTRCDVVMILLADAVVAVITAGLVAAEDDLTEFRHFRKNRKREKPLYIYDLCFNQDQRHGRETTSL